MIKKIIRFMTKNDEFKNIIIIDSKITPTPHHITQFNYNSRTYSFLYDFSDSPIYYDSNTTYFTNDFYLFKKNMTLDIAFIPIIRINNIDEDNKILGFDDECYIEGYPDNAEFFNELFTNNSLKIIKDNLNFKANALHKNINCFMFNYNIDMLLEHITRVNYIVFHNYYEKSTKCKSVIDYMKFFGAQIVENVSSEIPEDKLLVYKVDNIDKKKIKWIKNISAEKINKMISNYYSKFLALYDLLEEEYKCI